MRSPLPRFLLLYGALFSAFGVASPFLPGLLRQDGISPGWLGVVLAAGTAIRLVAGPVGGFVADRTGRPVLVLTACLAASALVACGYAPARGVGLLLLVSVCHAAVLAPLTPLADALALGSAEAGGFVYGWVRGAGSAAFIVGTLASGQAVERFGLGVIVWLNAGLLALAAGAAPLVPARVAGSADGGPDTAGGAGTGGLAAARALLSIPAFRVLMAVAALIGGSHALHDGFEVIRWRSAGLSATQASILWALSVAAEVLVFLWAGPLLLARLGTARALGLSAVAGMVRWGVAACTAWFPAMALVEPLHGLTFALLHLACMGVIARVVPAGLAASGQAFYATVAMGVAGAVVSAGSGQLYGWFGAGAFWGMAGMCGAALAVVWLGSRRGLLA